MTASRWFQIPATLALAGGAIATAWALTGTASRPQLTSSEAANQTVAKHLAQAGTIGALTTDNWDPSAGVALLTADYAVAADGSTRYRSVQAAVDAAVAAGGTMRRYISVKPGTYKEVVCVPAAAPPITLFGLGSAPAATTISFGNANPTPKPSGSATHPCASNASSTTVGTSDSGTVTVRAAQFQARNLAIVNSYVEDTYAGSNQSAVALALRGDKAVLENVALTGNQDTLLVSAGSANTVIRAFFKGGSIEGDTDFIFGSGVAVFSGSTIRYTAARRGAGNGGVIFAPSTRPGSGYGFLAVASTFDAVGGPAANTVYLGRAWDESVGSLSNYVNGSSPNGKVVIRESSLGAHVRKSAPWSASTVGRPYCSSGCTQSANRFYEYANSGAGSAD